MGVVDNGLCAKCRKTEVSKNQLSLIDETSSTRGGSFTPKGGYPV